MNTDVQSGLSTAVSVNCFPLFSWRAKRPRQRPETRAPIRKQPIKFEIVHYRGSYRSAGVGGGITGMGADILIIDDPHKDKAEAYSATCAAACMTGTPPPHTRDWHQAAA